MHGTDVTRAASAQGVGGILPVGATNGMDKLFVTWLIVVASCGVLCFEPAQGTLRNVPPVADAGSSRYVATESVRLDGMRSYDPDGTPVMDYIWTQISGPALAIADADMATPTVSGFVQTGEVQPCVFELTVSDGRWVSSPACVELFIVPEFGSSRVELYNDAFDPNKPTIIYYGGGDCSTGYGRTVYGSRLPMVNHEWTDRANILWLPHGYDPDPGTLHSYVRCGDMLICFLSSLAPDYDRPIQTVGWSTGGQPALDVAIRINREYQDPRYAINRVTLLDTTGYCRDDVPYVQTYLSNPVAGEQCWVDNYVSTTGDGFTLLQGDVLNVVFDTYSHVLVNDWYGRSLLFPDMNDFNDGVVAGAYLSVIGQGRNLQLGRMPGLQAYRFKWYGDDNAGRMALYNPLVFPGRLPQPPELLGPARAANGRGVRLSCRPCENVVLYQHLFGSTRDGIDDYAVVAQSAGPSLRLLTSLPYPRVWWTVRVWDKYGSSIYADPICLDAKSLHLPVLPQN